MFERMTYNPLQLVETARAALISYLNDYPEAAEFKETPDA